MVPAPSATRSCTVGQMCSSQHDIADPQPGPGGDRQQFVTGGERVRHRGAVRHRDGPPGVVLVQDEPSAHGAVLAPVHLGAVGAVGGEHHAVAVEVQLPAAVQHEVVLDDPDAAVTVPGGTQGAEPLPPHVGHPGQVPALPQPLDEEVPGLHRAHGVRAGRAGADREQVGDADRRDRPPLPGAGATACGWGRVVSSCTCCSSVWGVPVPAAIGPRLTRGCVSSPGRRRVRR